MSISSQLGKSCGRTRAELVNELRSRGTTLSMFSTWPTKCVVQFALVGFCSMASAQNIADDEVSE